MYLECGSKNAVGDLGQGPWWPQKADCSRLTMVKKKRKLLGSSLSRSFIWASLVEGGEKTVLSGGPEVEIGFLLSSFVCFKIGDV